MKGLLKLKSDGLNNNINQSIAIDSHVTCLKIESILSIQIHCFATYRCLIKNLAESVKSNLLHRIVFTWIVCLPLHLKKNTRTEFIIILSAGRRSLHRPSPKIYRVSGRTPHTSISLPGIDLSPTKRLLFEARIVEDNIIISADYITPAESLPLGHDFQWKLLNSSKRQL